MIDLLWAKAFLLTLAVEVPLIVALAPRERRRAVALMAAATQALTHPLAWIAFHEGVMGWWSVEVAVVVVEAVVYASATGRKRWALGLSLLANLCSAALGVWLLES